ATGLRAAKTPPTAAVIANRIARMSDLPFSFIASTRPADRMHRSGPDSSRAAAPHEVEGTPSVTRPKWDVSTGDSCTHLGVGGDGSAVARHHRRHPQGYDVAASRRRFSISMRRF